MSDAFDAIKQDTPRLVISFKRDGAGQEGFAWGVVGKIPTLSLVGTLRRVQADIFTDAGQPCPQEALVIVWDQDSRKFSWFIHPSIPIEPLAGMIEVVAGLIAAPLMAAQAQAMQGRALLGPDGFPIYRG